MAYTTQSCGLRWYLVDVNRVRLQGFISKLGHSYETSITPLTARPCTAIHKYCLCGETCMHTPRLDFESNFFNHVPASAQRYVPRTDSARGRPNAGAEMSSSRHRPRSSRPPLSITCRSRQNSLVTTSATLDLQRSSGQISNRLQKAER